MTDKPMTDIVERVRGHDWDGSGFSESLAEEAADEIERLGEQVAHWKAIAQAHNDSLVARIEENERLKQACDGYLEHAAGLRAENERLKACLHDYENTYPEAKGSLRAENARLVKEVERLGINEMDCKTLRAENERLGTDIALHESLAHGYTDDIAELQRENERLREALEPFAAHVQHITGLTYVVPRIWMDKARAALHVEESAPSAESATYNERWKSKP
jgi:DNA repair exonuclease SbcCD ATPase subunit